MDAVRESALVGFNPFQGMSASAAQTAVAASVTGFSAS
jgi:hypothetical protein